MKTLIALLMLTSTLSFAGDRTTAYNMICKNLSSESDRTKCVAKIKPHNYFGEEALAICAGFTFDSKKVECLDYIADKTYEAYEIDLCKNGTFESTKVACLKDNGTVYTEACIPKNDVIYQLRETQQDIHTGNLQSADKRLTALIEKFTVTCN